MANQTIPMGNRTNSREASVWTRPEPLSKAPLRRNKTGQSSTMDPTSMNPSITIAESRAEALAYSLGMNHTLLDLETLSPSVDRNAGMFFPQSRGGSSMEPHERSAIRPL
jgi:hypothetical protein